MERNFENHNIEESGTDKVITEGATMECKIGFNLYAEQISELERRLQDNQIDEEARASLKKQREVLEELVSLLHKFVEGLEDSPGKKRVQRIKSVEDIEDSLGRDHIETVQRLKKLDRDLKRLQEGRPLEQEGRPPEIRKTPAHNPDREIN